MTYKIIEHRVFSQPIAVTSTTQASDVQLGDVVRAEDPTYFGGEFIYLLGVASTVVGSWVSYDPATGATALLVNGAIGPVAVAMSANVADQYGWYQIKGGSRGLVGAAVATSGNLYATTTAGSVDDAAVTGQRIWGSKAASATTTLGTITAAIDRPFITNGLNSYST